MGDYQSAQAGPPGDEATRPKAAPPTPPEEPTRPKAAPPTPPEEEATRPKAAPPAPPEDEATRPEAAPPEREASPAPDAGEDDVPFIPGQIGSPPQTGWRPPAPTPRAKTEDTGGFRLPRPQLPTAGLSTAG